MTDKLQTTSRGFAFLHFKDCYDTPCSIQQSSLATENAIWFGVDDAAPMVMAACAAHYGINPGDGTGYVPFPIPHDVKLTTRMHLTQQHVARLLPLLQKFAATGELSVVSHAEICGSCNGTGRAPGDPPEECEACFDQQPAHADALTALDALASEAQDNGNSKEWTDTQVSTIRGAIAVHLNDDGVRQMGDVLAATIAASIEGEHEAFKAAMIAENYNEAMFDGFFAEGEFTYYNAVTNYMFDAWQAGRK